MSFKKKLKKKLNVVAREAGVEGGVIKVTSVNQQWTLKIKVSDFYRYVRIPHRWFTYLTIKYCILLTTLSISVVIIYSSNIFNIGNSVFSIYRKKSSVMTYFRYKHCNRIHYRYIKGRNHNNQRLGLRALGPINLGAITK